MPNWVYGNLAIRGKKNEVINFLNDGLKVSKSKIELSESMDKQTIVDTLNGLHSDDFLHLRSWLPMPQTFVDYDTTNNARGFENWLVGDLDKPIHVDEAIKVLGHLANETHATSNVDILHELLYTEDANLRERVMDILHKHFDERYNSYMNEYENAIVYQEKTYGCVGWYDYNCRTLGTKWDSEFTYFSIIDGGDTDELIIRADIDTAWNMPDEWLQTVKSMYPSLRFIYYGWEEGGAFCGYFEVGENGNDWIENDEDFMDDEDDEESDDCDYEDRCASMFDKFIEYVIE